MSNRTVIAIYCRHHQQMTRVKYGNDMSGLMYVILTYLLPAYFSENNIILYECVSTRSNFFSKHGFMYNTSVVELQ